MLPEWPVNCFFEVSLDSCKLPVGYCGFLTEVPEPGSLALLSVGLTVLLVLAWAAEVEGITK